MRSLIASAGRRGAPSLPHLARLRRVALVPAQVRRAAVATAAEQKPTSSALLASAKKLRDAFQSHQAIAEVAAEADAPVDRAAVLERLGRELAAGEEELPVSLLGEVLTADKPGRRVVSVSTPTGPGGGPAVRHLKVVLPSTEDVASFLLARRESKPRVEKNDELADILEKYLREKVLGKMADHVALLAAWGPKTIGDAEGELAEVAALMALQLRGFRAALKSSREDFQFEVQRAGDNKECLVMPPSNFALLGLKDAFHMLMAGYRVLLVVQPRFLAHFQEVQRDFLACGLPTGLLEVLPGITPEADPAVLHEVLKHVDRLQFTGSSAMFKGLVCKAYELGNLRMEHAGEVSGLNKVRLEGVSATHPAAATGAAWAAMANNGELCTSASLVEFDPSTGDTPAAVKSALESHSFRLGRDPADATLDVLLKDGKTTSLEVKTEIPADGFREWWEKAVLVAPKGGPPNLRTNQSLGHCVFAPTIERAVEVVVKEDASCLYCAAVPEDKSAPSARAGTTGCKVPESVFGGMKTHTFAVAGDHDGVGSVQTILSTVKRRGANWRDQEEPYAEYQLTETAEDLLEFLAPIEQKPFTKQIASVLEVFNVFQPEVSKPYDGQPLVGAEGKSKLVTLTALRPSRKHLLIPRGVGLPDEIVKAALLCEMSPLRELPVDLHLLGLKQAGQLRVTDPLKSFLRVAEKRLGWKLHWHDDYDQLSATVLSSEYPPYFFCVKDKHLHPELLMAVAKQGGYLYEGLPSDALSLFRWLTTSQAWTVACTESQVQEAEAALRRAWQEVGLRKEPHPAPAVVLPKPRDHEVGGGFGAAGLGDDKDWADLSDDDLSSDDEERGKGKGKPTKGKGPAASEAPAAGAAGDKAAESATTTGAA